MAFNVSLPGFPLPSFPITLEDLAYQAEHAAYNPPHFTPTPTRTGKAPGKPKTPGTHHTSASSAHSVRAETTTHTRTPSSGHHRKTGIHHPTTPRGITNQQTQYADAAAGVHKGVYDWFTNSGYGAKHDRVGYNTGVIPTVAAPPPVDHVTPGTINDSNAFPAGTPSKIPKATWPTQTTGDFQSSNSAFTFPKLKLVNGKWVLASGNETNQLLYGSNPSLTYANLVDPALHYGKKARKQKTSRTRTKHPRAAGAGRAAGLGGATNFRTPFTARAPAPVASRPLGHF